MEYTSISLNGFFEEDDESKLDKVLLPNFQREFQWERKSQQKLLASFLVNIPIGSMLLLKGEGGEFATRRVCYREDDEIFKNNCTYLLDGQQRFSTLTSIFGLIFGDFDNWREEYDKLYPKLQTVWFILIENNPEDPFGYKYLKFNEEEIKRNDPEMIEEYIEYKIINTRKGSEEWYHPNFVKKKREEGLSEARIKVEIAKEASNSGLVPMFGLLNKGYQIQEKVLKEIGEQRSKQLEADIEEDLNVIEKIFENPDEVKEYYLNRNDNRKDHETEIIKLWADRINEWAKEVARYLEGLCEQEIPIIFLFNKEIDRAVPIFDNMNKGGIALSTYDLIVAKAAQSARKKGSLTARIVNELEKKLELPESIKTINEKLPTEWNSIIMDSVDNRMPANIVRKQFLNILSIFHKLKNNNVSDLDVSQIKRSNILKLEADEINNEYKSAIITLVRVFAFLQFRCGVTKVNNINYDLMILPLALILRDNEKWSDRSTIDKLESWYWAAIFGGRYREKQNSRCIEDAKLMYKWCYENVDNPFSELHKNILGDPGYSDFKQLSFQNKADQSIPPKIANTILQYILSRYPNDFLPSNEFDDKVRLSAYKETVGDIFFDKNKKNEYKHEYEKHHVIPLRDATKVSETASKLRGKIHPLNSPFNFTYITSKANRFIGPKSPSDYMNYLSGVTKKLHLIPDEIKKKDSTESDEDYYLRFIKDRHNKLKESIKTELQNLVPS